MEHKTNNSQITYYSNKDSKHITRQAKWTEKCKILDIKVGDEFNNYTLIWTQKDIELPKGSWKVRS
jgi:hypothetical protein